MIFNHRHLFPLSSHQIHMLVHQSGSRHFYRNQLIFNTRSQTLPPFHYNKFNLYQCMCPVAVSVSTAINTGMNPELIANKRSDDIPITGDYRDPSIVEQSLSEER
ncbi:hypothetical protein HA402_016174 [Bradysia odoriphaga]|nr:hypothetical protein HA402_016174 [Bradysia odoriphaga]